MIRLLTGVPDYVVAFEGVGEVDAADYRTVLIPAVDRALAANDTIRLLHILAEGFDGYSGGALWLDAKVGVYSEICGRTLARAHARSGDRIAIASYLGSRDVFDRALARFARKYADQNDADYSRFTAAIKSGELPATFGM
jgi:hypothetical protein